LLAPSLPDRDPRASRVAAAPHSRAPDVPKCAIYCFSSYTFCPDQPFAAKGHQSQRDDILRLQKNLSNASGPVSTLADRMGSNPWSKQPSATVGINNATSTGTPRPVQAAPEPQRKPLVLAPRTQPLPVSDPSRVPAPASVVPAANLAAHSASDKPPEPVSNPSCTLSSIHLPLS
jgi:hypothetical protein